MDTDLSSSSSISLADPRVQSVPIIESHEPLIDLKNQSDLLFGPSPEIPNNLDYTKLRKTVYTRLLDAQKHLPTSVKFCLYEGYRSLRLQEKLFNDRYELLQHGSTLSYFMKPSSLFRHSPILMAHCQKPLRLKFLKLHVVTPL